MLRQGREERGEVGVDEDVRWKTSERNSSRKGQVNQMGATSFRLAEKEKRETKCLRDSIHFDTYQQKCIYTVSHTTLPLLLLLLYKERKFLSQIEFSRWIWFDGCKRGMLIWVGSLRVSLFFSFTHFVPLSTYISPVMGLTVWAVVKAWRRITSIPTLPWKSTIATRGWRKRVLSFGTITYTCKFHQKVQFKFVLNASTEAQRTKSRWLGRSKSVLCIYFKSISLSFIISQEDAIYLDIFFSISQFRPLYASSPHFGHFILIS